jgi:hypothetical protein
MLFRLRVINNLFKCYIEINYNIKYLSSIYLGLFLWGLYGGVEWCGRGVLDYLVGIGFYSGKNLLVIFCHNTWIF